jgi:hypothetical protein
MEQPVATEQSVKHASETQMANHQSPQDSSNEEDLGTGEADVPKTSGGDPEAEETPILEKDVPKSEDEKLSIVTGDDVKLETSLEHDKAVFDGREYTIEPYGVTFALRTHMGEPVVEDKKFVFSHDLSIDMSAVATMIYEVMENTSLNEAVDKELQDHKDSFYGKFIDTVSNGGLKGEHNQYKDDSVYSGVFFYEFDQHVLRIEYRCPIVAVDAMVRIVNETVDSVKMKHEEE